ncbi:hypothetical protein [Nocardia sp. NPDC057227]
MLVASGGPAPALERVCDAQRVAGHFVAAAPGFAERLERFLLAV